MKDKNMSSDTFFSPLAELSKHEGGGPFRWERERERGRHKNQKTTAQPTWWIMTAVKWITQDGEALQNIDLMLHPCREGVHPHYARSNIPNIPWAFGFPSHSERKTEAEIFLSHEHFRAESSRLCQWLALVLWRMGVIWSIPKNSWSKLGVFGTFTQLKTRWVKVKC